MPFLIDGNNLLHAMWNAGIDIDRPGLCGLLIKLTQGGQRVCVVFDGPPPQGREVNQKIPTLLTLEFSGHRPADPIIIDHIAADTAPHRLTVVSTDKEIRKAAHHRRCKIFLSEEFIKVLLHAPAQRASAAQEPAEKSQGLTEEQTRQWLREFNLDTEESQKELDDLDDRQ